MTDTPAADSSSSASPVAPPREQPTPEDWFTAVDPSAGISASDAVQRDESAPSAPSTTADPSAEARVASDASAELTGTLEPIASEPAAPADVPVTLVLERLKSIDKGIASFHERSSQYESTVRQLHSRVEALQQDQVRSLLKPAFQQLATLQAQALDAEAEAREQGADSAAGDFEFFATKIEEMLGLYDIDSVGAEVGQPVDPRRHHVGRSVKTDQQELDNTIQRVQRQGFTFAGAERVFLPARVTVYRYAAPQPHDEDAHAKAAPSAVAPEPVVDSCDEA